MSLISAWSISLDSTFNAPKVWWLVLDMPVLVSYYFDPNCFDFAVFCIRLLYLFRTYFPSPSSLTGRAFWYLFGVFTFTYFLAKFLLFGATFWNPVPNLIIFGAWSIQMFFNANKLQIIILSTILFLRYLESWRNLENNALSSLHELLWNRLVGGGGGGGWWGIAVPPQTQRSLAGSVTSNVRSVLYGQFWSLGHAPWPTVLY